jgi:hypothetical protein
MKSLVVPAVVLCLPLGALAERVHSPPDVGPKKEGVELELELGAGGCPKCAYGELGLALGGRAAFRWPSGLALGAYLLSINANGEGDCGGGYGYGYTDPSDCYGDELVLLFFGGEGRYYPLSRSSTSFDPYLAVGFGYGFGASRASGPDLAEYDGLALFPRAGIEVLLSDTLSFGGSAGRTFAFWESSCTNGDSTAGEGDFSCDDVRVNNPGAWMLTLDAIVRF